VSLVADRLQGGPGGRWCWSGTVRRSRHVRRYADPPVTSNLRRHHLAVGSPQEARDAQGTGSGPALPCCRTCPVIDPLPGAPGHDTSRRSWSSWRL